MGFVLYSSRFEHFFTEGGMGFMRLAKLTRLTRLMKHKICDAPNIVTQIVNSF